jgi:hypothetical protein
MEWQSQAKPGKADIPMRVSQWLFKKETGEKQLR